jgi:hypothetical protein
MSLCQGFAFTLHLLYYCSSITLPSLCFHSAFALRSHYHTNSHVSLPSELQAIEDDTTDNFIALVVDKGEEGDVPGCEAGCIGRDYLIDIQYYQVDNVQKKIITASFVGSTYDFDTENTEYKLNLAFRPLGFIMLIITFAFDIYIFMVIFVLLGAMSNICAVIGWAICRMTTNLQNPPQIKVIFMRLWAFSNALYRALYRFFLYLSAYF